MTSALAKQTLNFRFHNPNTAEETAEYLLTILIQANQKKIEQALKIAAESKRLSEE